MNENEGYRLINVGRKDTADEIKIMFDKVLNMDANDDLKLQIFGSMLERYLQDFN